MTVFGTIGMLGPRAYCVEIQTHYRTTDADIGQLVQAFAAFLECINSIKPPYRMRDTSIMSDCGNRQQTDTVACIHVTSCSAERILELR